MNQSKSVKDFISHVKKIAKEKRNKVKKSVFS